MIRRRRARSRLVPGRAVCLFYYYTLEENTVERILPEDDSLQVKVRLDNGKGIGSRIGERTTGLELRAVEENWRRHFDGGCRGNRHVGA